MLSCWFVTHWRSFSSLFAWLTVAFKVTGFVCAVSDSQACLLNSLYLIVRLSFKEVASRLVMSHVRRPAKGHVGEPSDPGFRSSPSTSQESAHGCVHTAGGSLLLVF